ncbi:MAG: phosphatase PAP2 family protein [Patescibacteria group bacterium]|jgi:membrane-associated phospholipid phosphatase
MQNIPNKLAKSGSWYFRIATLIAAAMFFIVLVLIAHTRHLSSAEISIFHFINGTSINLGKVAVIFMLLGSALGALMFGIFSIIIKSKKLFYSVLIGSILSGLVTELLKILINRPRPSGLIENVIVRGTGISDPGFPSGHTALATFLALVTAPFIPKKYRTFLWLYIFLIAIGRVYMGLHFPTDVLGGFFLGVMIAFAVRIMISKLFNK